MTWLFVTAWAGDAEHDAAFRAAREAEATGHYEEAIAACTRALAEAPSGARAPSCTRRNAFLSRRRDTDGGFAGWTALEEVRRGFRTLEPEVARARVAQIAESPVTSDVLRAEVAVWLAREALGRGEPERALGFTESVRELPLSDDPPVAAQVGELHAVALAELGRDAEAAVAEARVRVQVDPSAARLTPVETIWRDRRQTRLAVGSGVALVGFAALSLVPAWRSVRAARLAPHGLVPLALAAGVLGGLVWLREPSVGSVVLWMFLAFSGLHLLSAAALRSVRTRPGVASVRLGAALATFAAGYLVLWYTGTLMWVGG